MKIASVPSDEKKARFEEWMRAYENDVLRICFLYLRNRAQAQDAAQDTFLKVWRHMDKAKDNVKPWILRIAINTCKDYRLSAWARHVKLDDAPPALEPVEAQERDLYLDVLALPDREKQVVLLYHYQRLTLAETAKTLGVHLSTVVRRLKKAYALLRFDRDGRNES